jgi:hypothetical protein
LDCSLGFTLPTPPPVSTYAARNREEAIAEAFTTLLCPAALLARGRSGWEAKLTGSEFVAELQKAGVML